jgi:hypothetical protein
MLEGKCKDWADERGGREGGRGTPAPRPNRIHRDRSHAFWIFDKMCLVSNHNIGSRVHQQFADSVLLFLRATLRRAKIRVVEWG